MRALFVLLPVACLGCVPAANPAAAPVPVVAGNRAAMPITYDQLYSECATDPIAANAKYIDAKLPLRLSLTVSRIDVRRGRVSLVQDDPPIVANGIAASFKGAKPGDTVSVVGRLRLVDGRKLTLEDCRVE